MSARCTAATPGCSVPAASTPSPRSPTTARAPPPMAPGLGPTRRPSCAISAEVSAVLAVMRRGLRHPREDDTAAEHPLVACLRALRRIAFSSSSVLPSAALQPFLDAVRSEGQQPAIGDPPPPTRSSSSRRPLSTPPSTDIEFSLLLRPAAVPSALEI